MDVAIFHSYWTLVLLVVFIGIVIWAWSSKRQKAFDKAARIPLEEDLPPSSPQSKENRHG